MRLHTNIIVPESAVDTEPKCRDLVHQLVLRLERRRGHRIGWTSIGPLPIRDSWRRAGDGQTLILYVSEMVVCECCGGTEDLDYAPDPFESEINGDDTFVWKCGSCRHESEWDI